MTWNLKRTEKGSVQWLCNRCGAQKDKNDLHVWVINHQSATKGSLHAIGRIWLPPIQLRKAYSTSLIGISHRLRFVVCGVFLGSSHQHRSRTKNGIGSVSTHTLLSFLLLVRVALQAHSFMCSSRSSRFNLRIFHHSSQFDSRLPPVGRVE